MSADPLGRGKRLKLALGVSVLSRATGLILQAVAIPLMSRALGPEQFGVYVVLSSILSWFSFAGLGVGPALTLELTKAHAKEDSQTERELVGTAIATMALIGTVLLGVFVVVGLTVPVEAIFGPRWAPQADVLRVGFIATAGILCVSLVASITDSAYAGYQQQHVPLIWQVGANVVAASVLTASALTHPSILTTLLAVFGIPVLARLLNLAALVTRAHPHLRGCWAVARRRWLRPLLGTGLAFSLSQLAVFFSGQFLVLFAGRNAGPEAAAVVGVVWTAMNLLMQGLTMAVAPLWPAFSDAVQRQDGPWVLRNLRRLAWFSGGYCIVLGGVLAIGGTRLIPAWYGHQFQPSALYMACIGVAVAFGWLEYVADTALRGVGRVDASAKILGCRAVLTVFLAVVLIRPLGIEGLAVAFLAGLVTTSAWAMPLAAVRYVRAALSGPGGTGALPSDAN